VVGTDLLGNVAPSPATLTWTVAAPPPPPPPPAPPAPSGGGGGAGGGGIPPDLHVALAASAATAPPAGSELDFTFTVSSKNAGGSSDARLDVALPAGYVVSRTYADRGPGCTPSATGLSCDVAWINSSASTTVQIFGAVGQAGAQTVTATATSLVEPELDPSDNSATLTLGTPAAVPQTPAAASLAVRVRPTVTGTPRAGHVLVARAASWTVPPAHVAYQWQRCTSHGCLAIHGATSRTLRLTRAFVGRTVRVVETATEGASRAVAVSRSLLVRR
jgi:hypothetical protein